MLDLTVLLVCVFVMAATLAGYAWRLGWPLDFAPHVRPQLIALSVLATLLALFSARFGLAFGCLLAGLLNAQPYVTFARFMRARGVDGGLSVAWRDLGRRGAGVARLASDHDADVIVVARPPRGPLSDITAAFPDHHHVAASANDPGEAFGSTKPDAPAARILVLSRFPLHGARTFWPNERSSDRVVFTVKADGLDRPVDLVVLDTPAPITPHRSCVRDALLELAGERAPAHGRYLIIGAFNAAPWSGVFGALPGRRAGDPRARATWGSGFPLLGLARDHVMLGAALRLNSFEIDDFAAGGHTTTTVRVELIVD